MAGSQQTDEHTVVHPRGGEHGVLLHATPWIRAEFMMLREQDQTQGRPWARGTENSVSFWEDKTFLELGSGEDCITVSTLQTIPPHTRRGIFSGARIISRQRSYFKNAPCGMIILVERNYSECPLTKEY